MAKAKTAAQLQREIDEVLSGRSGFKNPRYIVQIVSGQLPDFVEELQRSRRNKYLGSVDCGRGALSGDRS